jgi:predicted GNAT family N-acyltransferase
MAVHAVRVDWASNQERLRRIREKVFTEEQSVPRDIDADGLDGDAIHFIALNEAGQALGTARLLPTGQIGRMAVLKEQRGRGIGRQLLDAAIAEATTVGLARVFLHAQRHAEDFYRKSGFLTVGAEFLEAGIPHVEMVRELPIPFRESQAHRGLPKINADTKADAAHPSRPIAFDSEIDRCDAVLKVLGRARRTVSISSADLDRAVFGNDRVLQTLSDFARRSRHVHVRVLVEDAKSIADDSHPLLELARRLPSKVEIRRLPDDRTPSRRSFVVVDSVAIWIQPDHEECIGWYNMHDRVEARRLTDEFSELFERSIDDPELRLLNL